jgi:hypothetical protein
LVSPWLRVIDGSPQLKVIVGSPAVDSDDRDVHN